MGFINSSWTYAIMRVSSGLKLHLESRNTPSMNILKEELKRWKGTVLATEKLSSPSEAHVCVFISLLLWWSEGALSLTHKKQRKA